MDSAVCIIFNNWINVWAAKRKQSVQKIMSKTIHVYTIYIINHHINLKILKDLLLSILLFFQWAYITYMPFSILCNVIYSSWLRYKTVHEYFINFSIVLYSTLMRHWFTFCGIIWCINIVVHCQFIICVVTSSDILYSKQYGIGRSIYACVYSEIRKEKPQRPKFCIW